MKLLLVSATVTAVTNLMLKHGSGEDARLVPATSLSLKAEVPPALLDELREGLANVFFEKQAAGSSAPRVPCLPELDTLSWKTEYQEAVLTVDVEAIADELDFEVPESGKLRFGDTEVKSITFAPSPKGAVDFTCNVIVRGDAEDRGRLTALQRHKAGITLEQLSQKPLAQPKKPADDAAKADDRQPGLPLADGAGITADKAPITPLVH